MAMLTVRLVRGRATGLVWALIQPRCSRHYSMMLRIMLGPISALPAPLIVQTPPWIQKPQMLPPPSLLLSSPRPRMQGGQREQARV